MKKALYIVLALTMAFGFLAGCAKEEAAAPAPAAAAAPAMEAGAPVEKSVWSFPPRTMAGPAVSSGGPRKPSRTGKPWIPTLSFVFKSAADAASMAAAVEDLMVQDIDGLAILPHDSSITPVVKEAYDAGIFTVVVDRLLTEKAQNTYLAGDNPGLGRLSAQWLAEAMGGEGKLVVLEGMPIPINQERVDAFEAVIAQYPGIEIMDSQPANWSTQEGLEIMENYLQKYPQIDAVFAQDDDVLKGRSAGLR